MDYVVKPGDSLWKIAETYLGNGREWPRIMVANLLRDPDRLAVGQRLYLPVQAGMAADGWSRGTSTPSPSPLRGGPNNAALQAKRTSFIPAAGYVFVLADEINPLTQKVVRRVLVNPKMAAEAAKSIGRPLRVFPNPERYGFQATRPGGTLPPGRHALGMKPSPFVSASKKMFGATRFTGSPFWIDVAKAEAAGATLHDTAEILDDLDRIAAKSRGPNAAQQINKIKGLVVADKEVLLRGKVPANAIKGPAAMAGTRVLQGVQIVGFALTAVNLAHATEVSIRTNSTNPIAAETVRQVGGWGMAWAGMKLGAAGGALLGIETGPGALVTGAIGGMAGGFAGYFGFDWIADHIHEN